MRTKVTAEKITSDYTGDDLSKLTGGWVLKGLNPASTSEYHFKSLSELLAALATQATIFGMTDNSALRNWAEYDHGVRITAEHVDAGNGRSLSYVHAYESGTTRTEGRS